MTSLADQAGRPIGVNSQTEGFPPNVAFQPQRLHKRSALRRWRKLRHLRKRHPQLKGVDTQHRCYRTLSAVQAGIRTRTSRDTGPKDKLDSRDYRCKEEVRHQDAEGKSLVFRSHAPTAFETIRKIVGIKEETFMASMTGSSHSYVEFASNSRSGADFYFSHDMRYILKTIQKSDAAFLLSILEDYIHHLRSYPHSLLARCLGCYSVKEAGKKEKYFLAMLNIFFPTERIEERFDIKGATIFRYQKVTGGSRDQLVLKDQNFLQEVIELGPAKDWFLRQITMDCAFLRDLDIMDYSLLIGRQRLHADEKHGNFGDLITRIQKSVSLDCCPQIYGTEREVANACGVQRDVTTSAVTQTLQSFQGKNNAEQANDSEEPRMNRMNPTENEDSLENLPGFVMDLPAVTRHQVTACQNGGCLSTQRSLEERVTNFQREARRLLPCCDNALHVLDGPTHRYFLGIVDILKEWKRVPKVKQLFRHCYCWGEHSTVPPGYYFRRFVNFISNKTG